MIVTHLSLTDFRNYEALELDLRPGPNIFVGSNGQGKTNLVEALGFISTLGSHRVSVDHALIRQDQQFAIIRAQVAHAEAELLAEVQINRTGANRAQVNRSAIKVRELPRYFSSVLFAPEDLALIRGDPAGRRRFLDDLLVLRLPRLSGTFADYDRVLRQRNSLLKTARGKPITSASPGTLGIWDDRLVVLGAEIIHARTSLTEELSPEVSRAYSAIVGANHGVSIGNALSIFHAQVVQETAGDSVRSGVVPIEVAEGAFREALARRRRAELERGISLVGPHRDDIVFGLNGLEARGYASHGESWSFALALKLAAAQILRRESTRGDPVLILDDVFAELDEARRARLAGAIADYEQVLITAAVRDDVPSSIRGNVVGIQSGVVVENE